MTVLAAKNSGLAILLKKGGAHQSSNFIFAQKDRGIVSNW
jgi:hypothetical protein